MNNASILSILAHATPTPTSRSKDQKSKSRGGGILWRRDLAAQLVDFTEVQQLMSEYLHTYELS